MKRTVVVFLIVLFAFSSVNAQNAVKKDALDMYKKGNYAEAIEVCLQELEEKPENLDSYVVLCWSLVANRQYEKAEYWATKGRTVSRYDHRLVEILAEAQFYLGSNDKALASFQEFISLVGNGNTRYGEAYYFMGEIYVREAKYNHADIAFSQAVMIEPTRDYWWTRLGYAREMAGKYTSAADAYDKALSLNPNRTEAKTGRARVLANLQ